MPLPLVALIGRTNVGKSALFNRLSGRRTAVVEDTPGVTRDRLYARVEVGDRPVWLIDTGGLVGAEGDPLIGAVEDQAATALAEADVLLLVFDGQEGLTSSDAEVAEAARKTGKPVVVAANKLESGRGDVTEFAELGFGVPLPISALHGQGLGKLEDAIEALLPPAEPEVETPAALPLAIVGRPNVGKSALVNALLGQPRMIVSEIPGTTRDAVDTLLHWAGEDYRLVDTPGLRRRGKRGQGLELFSSLRTLTALRAADVGVVVFDASEGFTQQDGTIALQVHEAARPLILVANKWDLVLEHAFDEANLDPRERRKAERLLRGDFERMVQAGVKFAPETPLLFTCALRGEGLDQLLPTARDLGTRYHRRVETGPLNRALAEALAAHPPAFHGRRQFKVRYVTQVSTAPPTLVLFVNDPELMHFSYERYLRNFFRKRFGWEQVPVEFRLRRSSAKEGK